MNSIRIFGGRLIEENATSGITTLEHLQHYYHNYMDFASSKIP